MYMKLIISYGNFFLEILDKGDFDLCRFVPSQHIGDKRSRDLHLNLKSDM